MTGFRAPLAGELCLRIKLEKLSEAADGLDSYTPTFTTVATVAARGKTKFGGRTLGGEQVEKRTSHVFTIRYRSDARADAWDHVQFNGRRFRVHDTEDPDERRVWLELLCEELGAV